MTDLGWWLIARTPDGVHVYPLGVHDTAGPGGDAAASALGDLVERVKAELGVPAGHLDTPGWDLQLTRGRPHPSMMATWHDLR